MEEVSEDQIFFAAKKPELTKTAKPPLIIKPQKLYEKTQKVYTTSPSKVVPSLKVVKVVDPTN